MIQMRGNRVGIEQLKASAKSNSVFSLPEDSNASGVIRFLGSSLTNSDLKLGMKVYYGTKRQTMTIDGMSILVMEEDNIVAVEEDASEQKASA